MIMFMITHQLSAQAKTGIDVAAIRNMRNHINGLNLSCFYHFDEKFSVGVEMNRFFPAVRNVDAEEVELSAWDFDLNAHYLFPLSKQIKYYPLLGISHTSEKEKQRVKNEAEYERFWSFNTGAGVLLEYKRWAPHIEYNFTWGKENQQFLLIGISYEIGKERKMAEKK